MNHEDGRLLYIHAKESDVLLTMDGVAILLRREHEAVRRYPLSRLSHITLVGAVRLDAEVLRQCSAHHITLIVADAERAQMTLCQGLQSVPSSMMARIEFRIAQAGWNGDYASWLMAMQRIAMRQSLAFLHDDFHDMRKKAVKVRLRQRLALSGSLVSTMESIWFRLLCGKINAWLREDDISETELLAMGLGIRFGFDFSQQLFWDFYPYMQKQQIRLQYTEEEHLEHQVVACFERYESRLRVRYVWLMRKFHIFLGSMG